MIGAYGSTVKPPTTFDRTEAPRHQAPGTGTEAPGTGTEAPRHRGTQAPRHPGTLPYHSPMRTVIAVAVGVDALFGVAWVARFVGLAPGYDATVWVMTGVRALVTVLLGLSSVMLLRDAPPARFFTRVAVTLSAVLLSLEIGARLAPSNLPPGTRGPVLIAYWMYAIGVWTATGTR